MHKSGINIDYSVVIPVYNSFEGLKELFAEIKNVFSKLNSSFEIVFVDDYSKDNSWEVLQKLKNENLSDNITVISLSENFGQQKATYCGLNYAKGDFIITIDDDLQISPVEIKTIIKKQQTEDFDVVYGYFSYNKKQIIRNIGSNTINKLNKKSQKYSSFRLIKKDINNRLSFGKHKANIFIDEMIYWSTGNIGFVEINHNKRKYNKSNYSTGKLIDAASKIILFSTDLPLKIIIYSGFTFSFLSFLLALRFIYRKLVHDVPLGYTSVIVTILFSTSILLLSIGVIGKYLQELYTQQNKKPPYLIKKIIT